MSKLLIFIGEGIKFDLNETIRAIKSIEAVTDCVSGDFIGAVFECTFASSNVLIRISDECETITTDGYGRDPIDFILKLQERLSVDLSVIDMSYSFNLEIRKFSSADELLSAMDLA